MKRYTVEQIEAACRALEAIEGKPGERMKTEARMQARDNALTIIVDGLAEIVAEHARANSQEPFIPGPIGKKGERA